MVNFFDFTPALYFNFFLIFLRLSGLFYTAPIISSTTVPTQIRIYLTLICTLIVLNLIPKIEYNPYYTLMDYFFISVKEVMIGLLLGVVPRVFFAAVDFAGTLIGFQMGFSVANVVDPQTDTQVSIMASFQNVLATLLFVLVDGHHIFFEVITISYEKIPIAGFLFSPAKIEPLVQLTATIFFNGLKLGAPLVVSLLFANVIMGMMARSVPNLNVFVVGYPFTIMLGLILMLAGVPYMMNAMSKFINAIGPDVLNWIQLMKR